MGDRHHHGKRWSWCHTDYSGKNHRVPSYGEAGKSKDSQGVKQATIRQLLPYKESIHTITSDNGSEFACHKQIAEALDIDFYFADPYSSWQRGLNEYTNKLVRQYIPKKTNFNQVNGEQIKQIQYKINRRPREKLKFNSPTRVFFSFIFNKVVLAT
ncbi:MAG: IS30 family transposase [Fermentimonas sp.]